jgi:cbb3-type cytochrome oxidase subunit 3
MLLVVGCDNNAISEDLREWLDEHITIGNALFFAFIVLIVALFRENKKSKAENEKLTEKDGEKGKKED